MEPKLSARRDKERLILIGATCFLFAFHLIGNAYFSYGYFRDELYYLACAEHPAWGYVDQPPLSIWILTVWKVLFGKSLFMIRMVPAIAIAGVIWFNGKTILRMGGNAVAVTIAAFCIITAPIFLAMGTYYSMNSLDMLFWSVAIYLVCGMVQAWRLTMKQWVVLGIVMGLALLNKISFLWFGAGLGVAMVATPLRKELTTAGPYVAAAIALVLFSPYIFWNMANGWAHVEFMQNALQYKYQGITRSDFISEVILQENPLAIPVWVCGLIFYFLYRPGRKYMALGLIFLTTFSILLINGHSKAEYLGASFPVLFAGGGMLISGAGKVTYLRWAPYAQVLLLLVSLTLAPMVKPLLAPEDYISFSQALGVRPGNAEGKEVAALHQFYADMHGWEEMAQNVSEVYKLLPEDEKVNARVYANNYGEAAALELYSDRYPLPLVMAGHNNYFLWGPGDKPLETVIIVGGEREDHLQSFEVVKEAGYHGATYAMPYENNLTIYVCRKPRAALEVLWPAAKNYN
ncbi:ArnT family glycosyltransferase [Roseivirga sp. BDSF3-8]|uniref:ArnT family glycosyltransferase n=1 Tax=Roseivirga sp. BDSF3-8 TaxID=3241598 RepID=UPI0035318251